MNIQAMMKQAQKLQKEMLEQKQNIDSKEYIGKSSFVSATLKGTKEIINIKIDKENIDSEEIEILEDMLVVAINDALKQIDSEVERTMGKYTNGLPGMF